LKPLRIHLFHFDIFLPTEFDGLVTFGPGYIAANTIAEDFKIKKWWSEPDYIVKARKKGYFGE